MLKELKTITLATLLVLGTAKLGSSAPLPSPNNQGDYTGRTYHIAILNHYQDYDTIICNTRS